MSRRENSERLSKLSRVNADLAEILENRLLSLCLTVQGFFDGIN